MACAERIAHAVQQQQQQQHHTARVRKTRRVRTVDEGGRPSPLTRLDHSVQLRTLRADVELSVHSLDVRSAGDHLDREGGRPELPPGSVS